MPAKNRLPDGVKGRSVYGKGPDGHDCFDHGNIPAEKTGSKTGTFKGPWPPAVSEGDPLGPTDDITGGRSGGK